MRKLTLFETSLPACRTRCWASLALTLVTTEEPPIVLDVSATMVNDLSNSSGSPAGSSFPNARFVSFMTNTSSDVAVRNTDSCTKSVVDTSEVTPLQHRHHTHTHNSIR